MSSEETNEGRRGCYEVLGVAPGAPEREVKAAYRDLAKVWHPDRFTHDPRLQQKAQEKLKEINEAYRQLTTGAPPPRRARAASDAHATARGGAHDARETQRGAARPRGGFDWRWLVPALAFCATFAFVTPRLLSTSRTAPDATGDAASSRQQPETLPSPGPRASQARDEDHVAPEHSDARARKASGAAVTGAEGATNGAEEASGVGAASAGVGAASAGARAARQPLATVSVMVDAATNQLARADCPQKLRVTFPAGEEPRAYCEAAHARAEPAANGEKARDKSRLKSFAGRVASPSKWLGGGGSPDAPAKKPDAPQQSPERD